MSTFSFYTASVHMPCLQLCMLITCIITVCTVQSLESVTDFIQMNNTTRLPTARKAMAGKIYCFSVTVSHTVSMHIPRNFWHAETHSLMVEGMFDPLETCPSPQVLWRQMWSFYVRRLVSNYENTPKKFEPSCPTFQGHSKSLNQRRSIGHL